MAARTTDDGEIELRLIDYPRSWDNPHLLDRYYNELDYSTSEIAADVFNGEVSRETIRKRLHQFGLMPEDGGRPSSSDPHAMRKLLLSVDKSSVGESVPEGDDSYKKYTDCGRGELDVE